MNTSKAKIYLSIVWLVLTSSLIIWWMFFALGLVANERHYNMLVLEGGTLLVLLVAGGSTLIYFSVQEEKRIETLKSFFAAFSHDMKTAVASLRLQTESLQDDLKGNTSSEALLERLVTDTSRILLATDNSLFLAQSGDYKLLNEDISINELLESMKASWPQIEIEVVGGARVKSDQRALRAIFENLVHNSISHGQSKKIVLSMSEKNKRVYVSVKDDGKGFSGNMNELGSVHYRPQSTSGSGLGLSIVKRLLVLLKSEKLKFASDSGFEVKFDLPVGRS